MLCALEIVIFDLLNTLSKMNNSKRSFLATKVWFQGSDSLSKTWGGGGDQKASKIR